MSAAFDYEALDGNGRVLKGRIDALTEREAQRTLEGQGLSLVALLPARMAPTARKTLFRRSVTLQDRILTLKQLALLLRSGVALVSGISTLKTQSMHPDPCAGFRGNRKAPALR